MGLSMLGRRVGFTAALVAIALVVSGFAAPAASASKSRFKPRIPKPQHVRMVAHSTFAPRRHIVAASAPNGRRADSAWPRPGTGTAFLAPDASGLVPAGPTPIRVGRLMSRAHLGGSTIAVQVLSQSASTRAGVHGPMFTVTGDLTSPTQIAVDYASFRNLGGANWGQRLQLAVLPACALTTPQLRRCQVETPLPTRNNGNGTLTATAPASEPTLKANTAQAAGSPAATSATPSTSAKSATASSVRSSTMVLAAASTPTGTNGSFAASSLAPSASWTAGGSSGAFTYSYPIVAPPAGTGGDVAPKVSLDYNSSAVDGQITTTNNQSSTVGEGWSYEPGYVERTYRTCNTDKTTGAINTTDLCWAGNIVTLHLPSGPTESLVLQDGKLPTDANAWHPQNDNGERVTLCTTASHPAPQCPTSGYTNPSANTNGAYNGEYWVVTTTDGTSYTFGLNQLPGGTIPASATNSAWTVPVYSPHTNDPCHTQSSAKCTMAWRWNLDMVQDTNHNAAAYYYAAETNFYGANGSTTGVSYTRGGYLTHIDYGLTTASNNIYAISAPDTVKFTVSERCIPTGSITCSDAQFTTANASYWPDTPVDLNCTSGTTCNVHAPTFWSRKRYTTIATSYLSGTTPVTVESYALTQTFPTTGDPEMWLNSIVRTSYGPSGASIQSPAVTFGGTPMDNRVAGWTTEPTMVHNRLVNITTETGEAILISYEGQTGQTGAPALCNGNVTPKLVPSSPSTDTMECFPVYWTQPTYNSPTLDYFHHYVVTEVDQQDTNATAPTQKTFYNYLGPDGKGTPAWHFDDNEVVQPAYRTYGQFRGYQQVETRSGNTAVNVTGQRNDTLTLTRTTYFRGMDGNQLPDGSTGSAAVTDSLGTSHTDSNQYAGQPLEVQVFNGDATTPTQLTHTITTYKGLATTATRSRTGMPALTAMVTATDVSTTYVAKAAGGADSTKIATTTYDNLYRPATVTTSASGAPTLCVATTYADNSSTWVRNRPDQSTTYSGACGTGTLMRETQTYYDNSTSLNSVTAGNATEVDQAKDLSGSTPTVIKTTSGYDAYGRVTTTTQYDAALGNRTTTTSYTPNGTGPLTQTVVTNAKSQAITTVLDPSRGVPTKITDISGRVTTATYDAMGRLSAVWKPGQVQGTNPATQTFTYLYTKTAPLAVTTKSLVDSGNGTTAGYVTSVKIYDAFGTLRQTQSDGVGGGVVVTDSYPDSHGWTVLTDGPWYTNGTPSPTILTTAASNISDRKISLYDGSGRVTQVNDYNGTTQTSTTRTIYGGDRTTIVPPTGGVTTTSIVDGLGNQVELDKYKTAPTISGNVVAGGTYNKQTFTFDALGQQLTRTTGATESNTAQQSTWTMDYDPLGRLTKVVSPDAGTTQTTYYDTGEVAKTTDGANRVLAYNYDVLGRKTGKYVGSTTGTQLAAWTYDTATNGTGQLASSTSYTGGYSYTETSNGYDPFGNSMGSTLTSTDPALSLMPSYKTSQSWTKTHLPATQTLASSAATSTLGTNAETLTFWYDNHGDPNGLTGNDTYVSNASYSPYGELSQYVLGVNNTTTSLTYTRDAQTRRITDVNLSGQTVPPQLEDMAYSYDLAGNITKVTDTQGASGAPVETQCFSYDGLDELIQAWSALDSCATNPTSTGSNAQVGGAQPYWTTWKYDDAGNRASQTQHAVSSGGLTIDATTTYTMNDPAHAHALSSTSTMGGATGSATYGYWPDGSLQTRTVNGAQATFTYGSDGQLASVQTAAGTSKYVRDADGNILTRTDPSGNTTLYLPGQEITTTPGNGTVTVNRYYALGGITVAAVVNRGNTTFLMSDLHDTNEVAVDPTTWAVTRRYLDPFGNALGAVTGGTWRGDHGFIGKSVNSATALTDVGAREYDPTTGRFTSVDPVTSPNDPLAANGYTYGGNNPLTNADPSGLNYPGPIATPGPMNCLIFTNCAPSAGSAPAPKPPMYTPITSRDFAGVLHVLLSRNPASVTSAHPWNDALAEVGTFCSPSTDLGGGTMTSWPGCVSMGPSNVVQALDSAAAQLTNTGSANALLRLFAAGMTPASITAQYHSLLLQKIAGATGDLTAAGQLGRIGAIIDKAGKAFAFADNVLFAAGVLSQSGLSPSDKAYDIGGHIGAGTAGAALGGSAFCGIGYVACFIGITGVGYLGGAGFDKFLGIQPDPQRPIVPYTCNAPTIVAVGGIGTAPDGSGRGFNC